MEDSFLPPPPPPPPPLLLLLSFIFIFFIFFSQGYEKEFSGRFEGEEVKPGFTQSVSIFRVKVVTLIMYS
jgi:hypothetical protein